MIMKTYLINRLLFTLSKLQRFAECNYTGKYRL